MLTREQVEALSPLAQAFLEVFRQELPGPFREQVTDRLVVTIPASHSAVGDLIVSDDGDQITLQVGSLFHWHFYLRPPYSSETRSAEQVSYEAVDFIRELLADAILIRVDFASGQPGVSSAVSTSAPETPRSSTERDFTWSGPRSPSGGSAA